MLTAGLWGVQSQPASAAAPAVAVDTGGTVLAHRSVKDTGALGVTFGFGQTTLDGKIVSPVGNTTYDVPMYEANTGSLLQFWENYVEELVSSGVDFVAVDTRGYIPGSTVPNEDGDPREVSQLVDAINATGNAGKLKIAAFDDTAASLQGKENEVKGVSSTPFDIGDQTGAGFGGYQYIWQQDLEAYFQAVPDDMRYKVNGQPLVYLWSDNPPIATDQGTPNGADMLQYISTQAQAEFGEKPYLVVDQSWIKNDPTAASVVSGADNWFNMAHSNTTDSLNGRNFGVAVPSYSVVDSTTDNVIDPNHGQTLITGLQDTVGAGDNLTLIEGFTDWLENAALFRTEAAAYGTTERDYPNQDINILRRYSTDPFPADMTVQAETADQAHQAIAGNVYNTYRSDMNVQTTTDTDGGWNVGSITGGDWEQWNEVPMQGTEDLKIRVATPNTGEQLRFVVDGVAGPTITLPNTGGWQDWQTVDAGTFQFNPGTYHMVQIQYLSSGINVDWWNAQSIQPAGAITGFGGKCVNDSGASDADGTAVQLWTCNNTDAQQWTVAADGSLQALGKCMDVTGQGTANGTQVQLWTCNGQANQQWRPGPDGSLIDVQSGRCLDATGDSSADGTRLQIWDCTGAANQSWTLPTTS